MAKKPKPKPPRRPKPYLWLLILLSLLPSALRAETPQVNIPPALRQQNWTEGRNNGSCVHASAVTLWNWQGQYAWSNYWKRKYGGGEYDYRLHVRCDAEGVTYADTSDQGDEGFLEWACRTRRGCLIGIDASAIYPGSSGGHALCVVHIDSKCVGILDNNGKYKIRYLDRKSFIRAWKAHGSWAWTPISTPPAPPLPRKAP